MSPAAGRSAATLQRDTSGSGLEFLAGGGEMRALMRVTDWSKTPLGPAESWSQSLKMMVSFLLANRFPLLLWWGPQYVQIYNDAYRPVLGGKHPRSMGQPCRECWSEIWPVLKPRIDTPYEGGPATWIEDFELELQRHGFTEETHFTVAYSPVPDETMPQGIGGVLATVHEITEKVIGERRIAALHKLGERSTAEAKTAVAACRAAVDLLAEDPKDVPFALIYLVDADGMTARCVAATGVPDVEAGGFGVVSLKERTDGPWPLGEALRSEKLVVIEDLQSRLKSLPPGPWADPANCAVVVPVRSNVAHQQAGLLVAGVSSRLKLNEQYRSFFELAASRIATAVANARAYEEERRRAEALASDVTERKGTEQVLREREEQLRLATEAAEVGLWDVDPLNDKLYWPPRVKAMFGISADVPVSMADFYAGLHPDDRDRTSEAFRAALDPERRALYDVEYRTVGKEDGLIRWVAAKGRGIFDDAGRCVRVIGTAIDITTRKDVEEHLHEREESLRQAHAELKARTLELGRFNQAAVGRELRMVDLKHEVNRLRTQLDQAPLYSLEFDAEPPQIAAPRECEPDTPVPLDAIVRTQELHERPARSPDYEAENRALTGLVQSLADSPRTILQTLADTTLEVLRAGSAGLSLLNQEGQRFYWAAIAGAWSPHLGGGTPRGFGPCGDVLDCNAPLLFAHWERRYPYLAEATPLAEEGLLVPFHVEGKAVGTIWVIAHDRERHFDAEDLRLLQSLGRFASAAYQAIEFLGAIDQRRAALHLLEEAVQAREQAEESNRKLRQSEEQLRDADQRKSEFLALLGHELRNPLSPISMASELLSRTLAGDRSAQLSIDMIKRQTAQLTRLVDDLLDIGRITQGRIQLKRCPLDLAAVIGQAVETVESLFRQKRHEVSIMSSYEPLYVYADSTRLVQCVVNLLTNAAKYTAPGGQIRIVTRAEGVNAVVEVSDTGAGIAPELLPRIFDLFVQSERTLDRAEGGLGIGLSVVKRLMEMHGGQVSAYSAGLGHGSTFTVRLPRIARPEIPAANDSFQASRRRILVVDDNADAADSLAMLLAHRGHETKVAYSAQQAIEIAESFRADVALLDIGLPQMNGYELAERLRATPQSSATRLVALTGYGQTEDRHRSQAAGFHDHLVKPVELPALERALAGLPI